MTRPLYRRPRAGDLLRLDERASVQFAGPAAITFRVIRVRQETTYVGWVWLDGYELNTAGVAVERRSVFVLVAGLHLADRSP